LKSWPVNCPRCGRSVKWSYVMSDGQKEADFNGEECCGYMARITVKVSDGMVEIEIKFSGDLDTVPE